MTDSCGQPFARSCNAIADTRDVTFMRDPIETIAIRIALQPRGLSVLGIYGLSPLPGRGVQEIVDGAHTDRKLLL